ncbi:MAG: hypothetical protein Q9O74_00335 [Planctomycetota bacterium]|nr:hypothetical protein [Planctomycetota bacterium]
MFKRRVIVFVRAVGVLALGVCAVAWIAGRVLSDRYAWSQPISWVPTPVLLVPVWVGCGIGLWRTCRLGARRRGAAESVRSRRVRLGVAASGLFAMLSVGHFVFVELGLHRAVLHSSSARAELDDPLRLVFWNQAGREAGEIAAGFLPLEPTFLVLANRHSGTRTRDLAQAFIDTGEAHAAVGWPFDLFSRMPVRRWASASLGLEGSSRTADGSSRADPGWAAWYEVKTPEGAIVIWAVDLPSDPDLARFPLARQAGAAIAAWQGSVRVIEVDGRRTERAARTGFPAPDLIVGDFNIPRRSASLGEFLRASGAGEMRSAFESAGFGWQRTWPRQQPVWAIDHCFVSPRVAVRRYTTYDPGTGGHRAIVIECDIDRRAIPTDRAP